MALAFYFKTLIALIIIFAIGGLFLAAIRKVAVNSIQLFLLDGIGCEANKLCYTRSEEAMSLLAAGKYEELKSLLIDQSATAEDEIRKLNLSYGEDE